MAVIGTGAGHAVRTDCGVLEASDLVEAAWRVVMEGAVSPLVLLQEG